MAAPGFTQILRSNPNCRYTWLGQIVSEVGDHFNNIAVLSLVLANSGSGLGVATVMIARALPAIFAGPLAGVILDRFDRKRIMIGSDLIRFAIALCFIFCIDRKDNNTLLYVLSAILMFASPFFTAGRASILPTITTKDELHTANSLTQTTSWATTAVGAYLGGHSVHNFGFRAAFLFNAVSFLVSALAISRLKPVSGSFRVPRDPNAGPRHPLDDYLNGLRYMRSVPLVFGIAMINVGWATGGGAAQILFSLFGEKVFHRGPAGTGDVWGSAAAGLIVGGFVAHRLAKRLNFPNYKNTVGIVYLIHGGAYVVFSQMQNYLGALGFIALSRAAVAVSSVMNSSQLLRHTANEYRGRVMSTNETLSWATQMLSMAAAGIASTSYSPRTIGAISGILSGSTGIWWLWLNFSGKLPEPAVDEAESEVEVHDPVG